MSEFEKLTQALAWAFALGLLALVWLGMRWHYQAESPASRAYSCLSERDDRSGANQKSTQAGLAACMRIFAADSSHEWRAK